jgi:hypothetical protein
MASLPIGPFPPQPGRFEPPAVAEMAGTEFAVKNERGVQLGITSIMLYPNHLTSCKSAFGPICFSRKQEK